MKRTSFFPAVLALALAGALRAEPVPLGEAVRRALGRAPGLQAAEAQKAEARAALNETRSRHWPVLRASMGITRADDPVSVFGTLLRRQSFGPHNFAVNSLNNPGYATDIRSALELLVPVFTGFELTTHEKLGALALRQTEIQSEAARQETRYAVVDAYLHALLIRGQLQTLDGRLSSAAAELATARQLRDKGLVLGSDYFAAEALEAGLKAWRVQLVNKQASLLSALNIWTGIDPSSSSLRGALAPAAYTVPNENELTDQAFHSRPEMDLARMGSGAADLSARQESRSHLPRVEAFASVESHTNDFSSNPSDRMLGLRAGVSLVDPSYSSRQEKAGAQRDAALALLDRARDNARVEVAQALRAYEGALESAPLLAGMRDRAARSLDLFRPLYREGRQSILDVLRAEESLARADSAYQEALYQVHTGYARLLLTAGRLGEETVQEISLALEARP